MNAPRETLLAQLSPHGQGAIATLAIRGPQAWTTTRGLFRRRGPSSSELPPHPIPGQFWPGRIGDDVVLAIKEIEPVPWLEMHCHGGAEAIRMLQDLFVSRSARLCTWQAFDRAAGVPGWQIAAKEMLVQAPTVRTAAILLDQLQGAFAKTMTAIIAGLEKKDAEATFLLDRLAKWANLGRHLVAPFRVGIAGAPNVGKSSLVNTLAGYSRSIVSPLPGTTRDVVTARLALDGWPVEIFDTAGLREAGANLEAAGMELAMAALEKADLVLWVLDGSTAPDRPDTSWTRILTVINKIDLPPGWAWNQMNACRVSALTREGLTGLCEGIVAILVPEAPRTGEPIPFTAELCERVVAAHLLVLEGNIPAAAHLLREVV